jgi:predicted nucleotidyltransferase
MQTTISTAEPVIVKYLREALPRLKAIYAYGSRVRGTPHPASDLDIAVLTAPNDTVPPMALAQIQGDLESLAGCTVDVSILDPKMQLVHCKEVVTTGLVLFTADPNFVAEFEMYTLSSYARLCEDRSPVIKAYQDLQNG